MEDMETSSSQVPSLYQADRKPTYTEAKYVQCVNLHLSGASQLPNQSLLRYIMAIGEAPPVDLILSTLHGQLTP